MQQDTTAVEHHVVDLLADDEVCRNAAAQSDTRQHASMRNTFVKLEKIHQQVVDDTSCAISQLGASA